jgi:Ca2+-binding RTX toxin-like protein
MLYGGTGNDFMFGGFGDDVLFGETGDDILGGGDDNDTLYGSRSAGVDEIAFASVCSVAAVNS